MRSTKSYTANSWGDQGDLVSLLATAKKLGKCSILVSDNPMCKPITRPDRFYSIKPLVESQPYIDRFDIWAGEEIDYDTASFRSGGIPFGKNLARLHSDWVGVEISEDPWLTLSANDKYRDKIVINRSPRHQNAYMPWNRILRHFPRRDMIFIGLPDEHRMFCNEHGIEIEYVPTQNLLEVGQIIQASKLFIGNQSSALNVAIGLGKRFLCECSLSSVDCLYHRPDSIYVTCGEFHLEIEGYEDLISPSSIPSRELQLDVSPPNGGLWIGECPDGIQFSDYIPQKTLAKMNVHERSKGIPVSTMQDVINKMCELFPTFGGGGYANQTIDRIKEIKKLINAINFGDKSHV